MRIRPGTSHFQDSFRGNQDVISLVNKSLLFLSVIRFTDFSDKIKYVY